MITGRVLGLPILYRIEQRQGYQPFRMSKEDVLFANAVFMLQKRKPWNEEINRRLHTVFEVGIVEYLKRKYISAKYLDQKDVRDVQSPKKFSLEHFQLAFLVLAVCFPIAGLVLALEAVIMRPKNLPV